MRDDTAFVVNTAQSSNGGNDGGTAEKVVPEVHQKPQASKTSAMQLLQNSSSQHCAQKRAGLHIKRKSEPKQAPLLFYQNNSNEESLFGNL